MQAIVLSNSNQYKKFLNLVIPYTRRISIFLLHKDKSVNQDFIIELDNIVSTINPSNGGIRKGYSGSIEYTLPVNQEIINLFYNLDNLFEITKTLINEDYRTRKKNFKLKVVPGYIGYSDIVFFDKQGKVIFQTITHEGTLLINGDKYPDLKDFITKYRNDEILLF